MDNSIYLLASAMNVAAQEQQRIANNLANLQTPGFKEILSHVQNTGTETQAAFPRLQQDGSWGQGTLNAGGNVLDVAIEGEGVLALESDGAARYFRSGTLSLNEDGFLVTSHGFKVMGEDGPIVIPAGRGGNLSIDSQGKIRSGDEEIATLKVVEVEEPQRLVSREGIYINMGSPERPANQYRIRQGFLENSTVDSANAVTEMIVNLRYFEATQKITKVVDESLQNLIQSAS